MNIKEILLNRNLKFFFYFITICCTIGALLQWLALPSIDHDELEAVRWGTTKSWFVDKHPPLVGIISFWWASLTNYSNFAFFILSKINSIIAIFIIYSLNRNFLSIKLSLISTAAYASTYAYIVLMSQLDANGVLHALWPAFCLYLWKSLKRNTYYDWMTLGIIAALTILGKYQSVLLLMTAILMILSSKSFRHYLLYYKFFLSFFVFILILTPHIYSYYISDYSVLDYIRTRGSGTGNFFTGRMSTLPFAGTQLLTMLFGYLILFWSIRKNLKIKTLKVKLKLTDNQLYFLIFFGLILPLSPLFLSLIIGISILGSWGLVSWFLFPTLILYIFGKDGQSLKINPYLYFVPFYLFASSLIVALNNFYPIARPTHIPLAIHEIEKSWFEKIDKKPHTVITNSRPAQGMTFYSTSKPQIIFGETPAIFSWILNPDKCTGGPTMIVTEETHNGEDFMKKLTKYFGKPAFLQTIRVKPTRYKLTHTHGLNFQIAGYATAICFE